jgi:hypothetical protein
MQYDLGYFVVAIDKNIINVNDIFDKRSTVKGSIISTDEEYIIRNFLVSPQSCKQAYNFMKMHNDYCKFWEIDIDEIDDNSLSILLEYPCLCADGSYEFWRRDEN